MGVTSSLNRDELKALDAQGLINLVCEAGLPQHCQACLDFGIDGDMVVKLSRHQLAEILRRAGIDSDDEIELQLQTLDKIKSSTIDSDKLDQDRLKELLWHYDEDFKEWEESPETFDWDGISVDLDKRVTAIHISNKNFYGEIPSGLGEFAHLEQFHASCNQFTGDIPATIGGLSRLTSLRLDHNYLSGKLFSSLTQLANLTVLDMARNRISGTIPTKLSRMTSLRRLSLGMNKLTGVIPKQLESLAFLVELRMPENKLEGKIPPQLGNMSSLQTLDLASNNLQGCIPASFGSLTDLRELWLSNNNLLGGIPETLGKLTNLQSLDLSSNKLASRLPRRVFVALSSSLVFLNLSRNKFQGEMPLGDLLPRPGKEEATNQKEAKNSGSCEEPKVALPAEMTGSPISYLNLSRNKLTGHIPEEIGALNSLTTLDLSHNKLSGQLPPGIGGCSALRTLSLSQCCLTGVLDGSDEGAVGPWGLGMLTLLETLRLDGNEFEGNVPTAFGDLTCLKVLQLQGNEFSGCLPSSLGQLGQLWAFVVRDNRLSGRVPESLSRLTGLRSLRLEGNPSLEGPIPDYLAARSECMVNADKTVLEDTEARMLGSRLEEWFLVPRKAFLNLSEFPGHVSIGPSLVRYVSTVVAYECHVFVDAKGKRLVVRRSEIAFFSHCWNLRRHQCPPSPALLEGPRSDSSDRAKLRHMKACLGDAPSDIQYVWLDMLCVPLADPKRRRASGRSLPFFVQNSARLYFLGADEAGIERLKTRAWCRLEALCAACPLQPCNTLSAFSPKPRHDSPDVRFTYDSVECFSSTWENGARIQERVGGIDGLASAGFIQNPATGKMSDQNDRQDLAEATLAVVDVMDLAGCVDAAFAETLRKSCKLIFFREHEPEGDVQSLLSLETYYGGHFGRFSRRKRVTPSVSSPTTTWPSIPGGERTLYH